jgi:pimeloyl-ACP methyl ester carboxylesterase
MSSQTRLVPTLYNDKGEPYCSSITSSSDNKVRAKCILPPHKVIPVIFVPGIMGSNLISTNPKAGDAQAPENPNARGQFIAWNPDSIGWVNKFRGLKAKERQVILDPNFTEVGDLADVPDSASDLLKSASKEAKANWTQEFKRRGWGTVFLSSYSELLCQLEFSLNRIYQDGSISAPWKALLETQGQHWGEMKGFSKLTENDLFKAADYWYPVHAVGYNWLKSNKDAARHIAGKINEFIGNYKKLGFECEKAILVTHSMGGLAARAAAHAEMGNAAASILGIVHGVQPATGAATAYKRVHAGFEAGWDAMDAIVAQTLGWSGEEVTAVFASSPGALQLLPNKLYPKEWLRISREGKGDSANDILKLPLADPYAEIYREKDQWWRLIDPALVDPSGALAAKKKSPWDGYLKQLALAEKFHDTLKDHYHTSTWVHYGADPKQKAWGKVRWIPAGSISYVSDDDLRDAHLKNNDHLGTLVLQPPKAKQQPNQYVPWWNHMIEKPISDGDGTVPEESGRAPEGKAKFIARMTGFDHQGSYKNPAVQNLTMYCIAKIAQDAA